MLLKRGDTGEYVIELQKKLGIPFDGDFGDITEKAVISFQKKKKLTIDGVVGRQTWEALGLDTDQTGRFILNNRPSLLTSGDYLTKNGLKITKHYLDTDEYVKDYGVIEPLGFFIHHTAGWDNPFKTIDDWNNDKRGRIATQYVIGGSNIKGNSKTDGVVTEAFPNGYLAWHLGVNGKIHNYSGGVELCNFGQLYERNGKFYTWVAIQKDGTLRSDAANYEVNKNQVYDLGYMFKGFRYYHNYSDNQLESLKKLFKHLKDIYPKMNLVNGLPKLLKEGLDPKIAFDYNKNSLTQFGLWSHSNILNGKSDCYPHLKLIEILKNL